MSIYRKLQEARCELQKRNLKKSGQNKFAKYDYFELGDFLPAINDLFLEKGLCSIVTFNSELATLTIYDLEDNSCVSFTSPFGSADLKGCHPVQNIGAVETYQRRYFIWWPLRSSSMTLLSQPWGTKINNQKPRNRPESLTRSEKSSSRPWRMSVPELAERRIL